MAMRALVHAHSPRGDRADGHQFLFQVNEEDWPTEGELKDVIDEYLLGYGSIYFYDTPWSDGIARELVAGSIDY